MKCSFCGQVLLCKACRKPFHPTQAATYAAAFQPDMQLFCPECRKPLACRLCGYVYGDPDAEQTEGPDVGANG